MFVGSPGFGGGGWGLGARQIVHRRALFLGKGGQRLRPLALDLAECFHRRTRFSLHRAREMPREQTGQKGAADALGILAIETRRIDHLIEPETVHHGGDAIGNRIGADAAIAALLDQALEQRADILEIAGLLASDALAIAGIGLGLGPEGIPDRHLFQAIHLPDRSLPRSSPPAWPRRNRRPPPATGSRRLRTPPPGIPAWRRATAPCCESGN